MVPDPRGELRQHRLDRAHDAHQHVLDGLFPDRVGRVLQGVVPDQAGGHGHAGEVPERGGGLRDDPFRLLGPLADVAHDRDDLDRVLCRDRVGRAPGAVLVAPADRDPGTVGRERSDRLEPHPRSAPDDEVPLVPHSQVHADPPARPMDGERLCRFRPHLVVHRVFERGANPDRLGGLDPIGHEHALHHVVERGLERAAPEAHRHDRAAGIAANGARRTRNAGRAPERRHRQPGRVRGAAEAAGGIGEAQRGKVFHVAQHRAGV